MKRLLLLALMLPACAPQQQTSGEQLTIVSLNPCADAVLAELTGPEQLLAISHYSHDRRSTSMELSRARQFGSTGGSAEEVIALGPDVVVADIFLPPATRAAFEKAGIEIVQTGIIASLEDSDAQIRQLSAVVGEEAPGEAMIAQIQAAWDAARWRGAPVPALLWQEGGIVPGEDTLAAAMLEQTGFSLHSAAKGLGQGAYLPLEAVLADPPQVVLASGTERMLRHPVLRQLDNVTYRNFDSGLLYCGGPTIIRALERLAEIRRDVDGQKGN